LKLHRLKPDGISVGSAQFIVSSVRSKLKLHRLKPDGISRSWASSR